MVPGSRDANFCFFLFCLFVCLFYAKQTTPNITQMIVKHKENLVSTKLQVGFYNYYVKYDGKIIKEAKIKILKN